MIQSHAMKCVLSYDVSHMSYYQQFIHSNKYMHIHMHTTNKSQKIVHMLRYFYAVHSWFCQDPLVTRNARGLLIKVQDTIIR